MDMLYWEETLCIMWRTLQCNQRPGHDMTYEKSRKDKGRIIISRCRSLPTAAIAGGFLLVAEVTRQFKDTGLVVYLAAIHLKTG